jgi:putative ABC transport system permease protein
MYYHHATYPSSGMQLVVRAQREETTLMPAIRQAVLRLDQDVPLENVVSAEEIVSNSLSTTRLLSVATAVFAVTALLLSLTGVYAVLAFYVGRRTREIGIRVAFGATGGQVSGMVLWRGLGMVGTGLGLGLMGAGLSARVLQSQLYQVGSMDPVVLASVSAGFIAVGALAAIFPAQRATRVDPVRAMQVE